MGSYQSMLLEVMSKITSERPVSARRKDWAMLGWSMGGFGAMHFAEDHPDRVGFVGSIIGLLDFSRSKGLPADQQLPIDTKVFGDDPREWKRQNPSQRSAALRHMTIAIVIADQAFDRTMNEDFLRCAGQAHLRPEITRIEGQHVFTLVEAGLDILLPCVAEDFQ